MKPRFSILIVNDLPTKSQTVRAQIAKRLKHFEMSFEFAINYETARDSLKANNFDFVILDLKIPAGTEAASEKWSRQLLRDIVDQEYCFPMHVFGLTMHAELAAVEAQFYEENTFGFYIYDDARTDWADKIAAKIEYLAKAVQNGASYRLNSFDFDLAILTARNANEFEPIKQYLFGSDSIDAHPLWPGRSHIGQIALKSGKKLRTALLCIGSTGLAPAATVTTQAIQILRPATVAMLGMCAGFTSKGAGVLDVLIARESACWQEGKSFGDDEERFEARGKTRTPSTSFVERIDQMLEFDKAAVKSELDQFSRTKEYLDLRKQIGSTMAEIPQPLAGLIVSGSEVVASAQKMAEIQSRHPTAYGLEMEIFAVYTAAMQAVGKKPEFLAIKGIADFGDSGKKDHSQQLASKLSALMLKLFLGSSLR